MSDLHKLIPKTDMIAWHRYDAATSTNGNINDASGNGRHLVQATNPPVLTPDAWNGQPAWYFDGTSNPLAWSGSVTPKHVFIVAAFEEFTLRQHRGLFSGPTTGDWLMTVQTGTRFFTFGSSYKYRKADVLFADQDWQAPMGFVPLLIEVSNASGVSMDGLQIGRQKADSNRKFRGYFLESLVYSSVCPDYDRDLIAEYVAQKFHIWRRDAEGRDVWPFQPDISPDTPVDKVVLTSLSISGVVKSRAKSAAKDVLAAKFSTRADEERDAARAFWDAKYPGEHFVYRDSAFLPARDNVMRFTGGLDIVTNGYNDHDYQVQAISADIEEADAVGSLETAVNWALNAPVTANRTYSESRPEQAVNGVRHTNNDWAPFDPDGGSGGWDSDQEASPAILELDFGFERTFSHVKMFTLKDTTGYATEPALTDTFTLYGNTSYNVDYWNGKSWVTFISVTGNNRVRREHDFPDITARLVRFVGLGTADHPSTPHARLVEFEVWNRRPFPEVFGELEAYQKRVREQQWPSGLPLHIGATSFTANGGPSAAFDLDGDSDLLTFDVLSGLTLNGYVYSPIATPPVGGTVREAWVIMVLGHETVAEGIDRVQYLVDRGFKVVLLGMPNYEPNSGSWTYTQTSTSGTVSITGGSHAQFASVIEADGTPILPLFLDQIFRTATWIREQDADAIIHLTGHSGGAFMTTMAAALDQDQIFTVKNANVGELPFSIPDPTVLHVEQTADRPWWFGKDWETFYMLAARYGVFTKSHNEIDTVYPAQRRHHVFRNIVTEVNAGIEGYPGEGKFDIYIDLDQAGHDYTPEMLEEFHQNCLEAEPSLSPLDPSSIAWAAYIADSYVGLVDGDNVGTWNDASSNDRDATVILSPQWRANQLNGHSALEMTGDTSDGFTLPSMAALTELSSIEISKTIPTGSNGGSYLGTDAVNEAHFPYQPDLKVYDPFGSTARKGPITPTVDLTDWAVHYWWSKTNDWGFQSNWNTPFTTATNTVSCPSSPKLWQNGGGGSQKGFLVARWIFPFKLTEDQKFRIRLWIENEFF